MVNLSLKSFVPIFVPFFVPKFVVLAPPVYYTTPYPTPPDPQLQLEFISPLQNLIIYHKMDINKSAWINP